MITQIEANPESCRIIPQKLLHRNLSGHVWSCDLRLNCAQALALLQLGRPRPLKVLEPRLNSGARRAERWKRPWHSTTFLEQRWEDRVHMFKRNLQEESLLKNGIPGFEQLWKMFLWGPCEIRINNKLTTTKKSIECLFYVHSCQLPGSSFAYFWQMSKARSPEECLQFEAEAEGPYDLEQQLRHQLSVRPQ